MPEPAHTCPHQKPCWGIPDCVEAVGPIGPVPRAQEAREQGRDPLTARRPADGMVPVVQVVRECRCPRTPSAVRWREVSMTATFPPPLSAPRTVSLLSPAPSDRRAVAPRLAPVATFCSLRLWVSCGRLRPAGHRFQPQSALSRTLFSESCGRHGVRPQLEKTVGLLVRTRRWVARSGRGRSVHSLRKAGGWLSATKDEARAGAPGRLLSVMCPTARM
jgi:hypothetical protein